MTPAGAVAAPSEVSSPGGVRRWRPRSNGVLLGLVVLTSTLPVALLLVSERRLAGAAGFPLDDSWIHLHFARNLAEGAGFSYNPGVPVAGSTAPLWTLLLGLAFVLFGPSVALAKIIGIVTAGGAALLTARAAAAWGAPAFVAGAAAVGLAWTGAMAWGALSGMEVPLAALLVAAAVLAHARDSTVATALLAGLAALARPEAIILVPLLALARPPAVRRLVVFAMLAGIVLAPAVLFSLATVGAPVPATAAAKIEGGLIGWLAGVREPAGRFLLERPAAFGREWLGWLTATHALLVPTLAAAIVVVWRRHGRSLGVPALALIAHPLAMAVLAPYRGPGFQEGRYSVHLLPLAFVVLAAATPALRAWRRIVLVAAWLVVALAQLPEAATRYAWGVQNINAMQVELGRWVDAHLPKDARLALNDIGAIAYVSRRPVIDLMGLVTPEILPYRRRGEAGVIEYVTRTCPDYVIVFPAWFPALTAPGGPMEPLHGVRLARNEVAGAQEMIVYRLKRCEL